MPINITPTGPIRNRFQPNQAQRSAAHAIIAQLQYADIWRGAGVLYTNQLVRLDMQGWTNGTPRYSNLQVQVNGQRGSSTIAHVLVSWSLNGITNSQNQRGVVNAVISALNQSLDSGNSFSVNGSIP